ncbi:Werner syndrome ATP-dependent helicase-like isoform X2 [Branchiostoma floridae]|nr:Werner syndrome ATP-dependent helicase-like isoform X2 [Branchiostoma floridae]
MLTATATEAMVDEIIADLHLSNVEVVSVLPNRPNIHLQVRRATSDLSEELGWLVSHLKKGGKDAGRTLIYCRTINTVYQVWGWLMKQLGTSAWTEEPHTVRNRIVDMYHGQTDDQSQKRELEGFTQSDSCLRCVVATNAFGMGVQVDDVRYVIHWGPSKDVLSYWQEVGRCARDGQDGHAIMYVFPHSLNAKFINADMITLVRNCTGNKCIRKQVLEHLFVKGMDRSGLATACNLEHGCCSNCDDTCKS